MIAALAVVPCAHAHLVQTGVGRFYDGAAHFLVTVPNILMVVALGLLAGLAGKAGARIILAVLPLAWIAGGWIGAHFPAAGEAQAAAIAAFGIAGLLVAFDTKLPRWVLGTLAGIAGAIHGYPNGVATAPEGGNLLALAGATTCVILLSTSLAAPIAASHAKTLRIGVRVVGSWIAAIALLMFGWLARSAGQLLDPG